MHRLSGNKPLFFILKNIYQVLLKKKKNIYKAVDLKPDSQWALA